MQKSTWTMLIHRQHTSTVATKHYFSVDCVFSFFHFFPVGLDCNRCCCRRCAIDIDQWTSEKEIQSEIHHEMVFIFDRLFTSRHVYARQQTNVRRMKLVVSWARFHTKIPKKTAPKRGHHNLWTPKRMKVICSEIVFEYIWRLRHALKGRVFVPDGELKYQHSETSETA